jgi:hypothetical protein
LIKVTLSERDLHGYQNQDGPQLVVSNGNKLIIVGRTSKEVGRAKHALAISYWRDLVYICIFPLGNSYFEVHVCNN